MPPIRHLHSVALLRALALPALVLAGATLPHAVAAQAPTPPPAFSAELALQTFDSAWSRIANTHYDPDMGGVDWEEVRADLEPRARAAGSNDELRAVLRDMVARLGLSHFAVFAPEAGDILSGDAAAGEAGTPGGQATPGIDLRVVEGELVVVRVREGGPADAAGIRPGWRLLEAAGQELSALPPGVGDPMTAVGMAPERIRALYLPMLALALLQGASGDALEAVFEDEAGVRRTLSVDRAAPAGQVVRFGNLPPFAVEAEDAPLALPGGGTAAWIRFSAWFPAVVPELSAAVERSRGADGIVLDLRGNPGGLGAMAMGVGGHFLDEPLELGEMRTRDTTLRFVVNPQRVNPAGERVEPFAGPLAILVDPLTASTSEIFAAGLQSLGRARIFGETTAGQALPAVIIPLPNGDRLMHVIADYTAPGGVRLEGRGVVPDEVVLPSRAALAEGRDLALEAALAWIAGQGDPSSHP